MRREVDEFGDVAGSPVRRHVLARIETEAAERALVVFEGLGGLGKTATMQQWAKELSDEDTSDSNPIVSIRVADDLASEWIADLVHRWNPAIDESQPERALERLQIANPANIPPLLHLSLDGADDFIANPLVEENVRHLAKWFWRLDQDRAQVRTSGPPARLVVTCRDAEHFSRNVLRLSQSGSSIEETRKPLSFVFERFNNAELRQLLELNFPYLMSRVFITAPTASLPSANDFGAGGEALPAVGTKNATGKIDVIRILRDPLMWRSFCEITNAQREALLEGDRSIELLLGERYVNRFAIKARSRVDLDADQINVVLTTIARQCFSEPRRYLLVNEWVAASVATGIFNERFSRLLFREALSGGLIIQDAGIKWQWRNPIVEEYLRSNEED
jgi:hypothetical protein